MKTITVPDATLQAMPPRKSEPVRFDEWPERPAANQAEVDELVDWAKGDR